MIKRIKRKEKDKKAYNNIIGIEKNFDDKDTNNVN